MEFLVSEGISEGTLPFSLKIFNKKIWPVSTSGECTKNTNRILPTWLWTHFSLSGTNAAIHDSCQNHAKNSFICVVFVDFANKSIFFALVLPFIRRNPLYTGKLWPSFLALFFMGYLDGIPAVLSHHTSPTGTPLLTRKTMQGTNLKKFSSPLKWGTEPKVPGNSGLHSATIPRNEADHF